MTHEILQAAVATFIRWNPKIKRDPAFQREVLKMEDGELLALDWLMPTHGSTADTPIVFVCHGLAGHSDELNMQYLALEVRSRGCRFALLNRRGCAHDMVLQRAKIYEYGCTKDLREVLAHVKHRFPNAPLLGVGYSAGSNLITRYLGETGPDSLIDAALSVANAFNLETCSRALAEKPFYATVMRNILLNLLSRNEEIFRKVEEEHRREEEAEARAAAEASSPSPSPSETESPSVTPRRKHKLDLRKVKKVKSVLDWDENFNLPTVSRHFSSISEFYAANSTNATHIARISVPLLNIYALDDPILPPRITPSKSLLANPLVIQATTHRGGHIGWVDSMWPFNSATWMETFTAEWALIITSNEEIWKQVKMAKVIAKEQQVDALEIDGPSNHTRRHQHSQSHSHANRGHGIDVGAGALDQSNGGLNVSDPPAHSHSHSHSRILLDRHPHPLTPSPVLTGSHLAPSALSVPTMNLESTSSHVSISAPSPSLSTFPVSAVARYESSPATVSPMEEDDSDFYNRTLAKGNETPMELEEEAEVEEDNGDSPVSPLTPHPQPHGWQLLDASSHTSPQLSHRMDFSFDSASSSSSTSTSASAGVSSRSPAKRRKLDSNRSQQYNHAAAADDDEKEEEPKEERTIRVGSQAQKRSRARQTDTAVAPGKRH